MKIAFQSLSLSLQIEIHGQLNVCTETHRPLVAGHPSKMRTSLKLVKLNSCEIAPNESIHSQGVSRIDFAFETTYFNSRTDSHPVANSNSGVHSDTQVDSDSGTYSDSGADSYSGVDSELGADSYSGVDSELGTDSGINSGIGSRVISGISARIGIGFGIDSELGIGIA